jgi:hypothetical protein
LWVEVVVVVKAVVAELVHRILFYHSYSLTLEEVVVVVVGVIVEVADLVDLVVAVVVVVELVVVGKIYIIQYFLKSS